MCWSDGSARQRRPWPAWAAFATLAVAGSAAAEPGDYVLGAGVEGDSEGGFAVSALADVALAENTWLAGSVAHSGVDLPRRQRIDYLQADLGIDHYFDPVGIRLGVAYWGDSDILDSTDVRASLYASSDERSLSFDAERRDFDFVLPALDAAPRAPVGFHAKGLGLSGRIAIGDRATLRAAGMHYDYSREFRAGDAARVTDLVTFSRISVLTSLVEWRARAGAGIDAGQWRWQLDVSKWRGAVDGSDNAGITLGALMPMSPRTDIDIRLGYDDSDLYESTTFLSVFVYFYGGD